ncbi:hypothetical protein Mapa_014566 [Marchantia paleacea]|nr:hypothetical protein Mapa_014566 [Marchantia paleacea]
MATVLDTMIQVSLGLTVQELGNLGAFGVIRESVKVFGGARPALVWIQFALVLPFTIFVDIDQYLQHKIVDKLYPDVPPPPSPPIVRFAGPIVHLQKWLDADLHEWMHMDLHQWLGVLSIVVLVLLSFFLALVVASAIYHAVGCIVHGKNLTFCEAMQGVPRLWKRLFVTSFVNLLLVLSSVLVFVIFVVIFKLAIPSAHEPSLLAILVPVVGFVFLIPIFIIYLMFQVANGVTCFEEAYGLAAFRRAKHILHGKWWSAVLLFILLAIPTTVLGALVGSPVALAKGFSWTLLVLAVVYVIFTSYLYELIWICWAVFYFSCSASNDHRAAEDDRMEATYQALANDAITVP